MNHLLVTLLQNNSGYEHNFIRKKTIYVYCNIYEGICCFFFFGLCNLLNCIVCRGFRGKKIKKLIWGLTPNPNPTKPINCFWFVFFFFSRICLIYSLDLFSVAKFYEVYLFQDFFSVFVSQMHSFQACVCLLDVRILFLFYFSSYYLEGTLQRKKNGVDVKKKWGVLKLYIRLPSHDYLSSIFPQRTSIPLP